MKKILASFIAAMAFGCSIQAEEPIASEELALPVTTAAPCIRVTCDQATCNGTLTVTQTVPAVSGNVEIWAADLWTAAGYSNLQPSTMLTQSSGLLVTRTPVSGFRQNDYFCLLTSVVVRNAAGNVVGAQSAPVVSDGAGGIRLQLQPSAVTATVTP